LEKVLDDYLERFAPHGQEDAIRLQLSKVSAVRREQILFSAKSFVRYLTELSQEENKQEIGRKGPIQA